MDALGAAVLRMQADRASPADIWEILQKLLDSEEFRTRRARALGTFVHEIKREQREEHVCALVLVLFTLTLPTEPAPIDVIYTTTTPQFTRHCTPPHGPWNEGHLRSRVMRCALPPPCAPQLAHVTQSFGKWEGLFEYSQVSPYLRAIIIALEEMWDTRGYLIPIPSHT
jgi:hypothetical protein